MQAKEDRQTSKAIRSLVLAGAALTISCEGLAQNKTPAVPDAQVESNVLRALAADGQLADQQISSAAVYGVVTLSGQVKDEATRSLAEDRVSRAPGVQKVVDELTIGNQPAAIPPSAPTDGQGSNPQLQSDGTLAPSQNAPPPSTAQSPTPENAAQPGSPAGQIGPDGQAGPPPGYGANQPGYGQQDPSANGQPTQPSYGQQGQSPYPQSSQAPYGQPGQPPYSQQGQPPYGQQPYPQQGQPPYGQQQTQSPYGQQPYPQQGQPPYGQQQNQPPYGQAGQPPYGPPTQSPYGQQSPYTRGQGTYAGQPGGQVVSVPAGATVQLRINQGIDSKHSQVGSMFSGTVIRDVAADGLIAIPRGATVQGTVVDASKGGAIKGRAVLALQLNQVTLSGRVYPIASNVWQQDGPDKTGRTVGSAIGLGVVGALIGGVAGGGAGAAIGAGAGGAAGIGASAASGNAQVFLPPEAVIAFQISQPVSITTVSQAEVERLGYGLPGGAPQQIRRRYPPPPPYYYGPGYYYGPRAYYRSYPY